MFIAFYKYIIENNHRPFFFYIKHEF